MKAVETELLTMVYSSGLIPRKKMALDSLDLEVEEGEIFGYLGPNGAGKTTTIKILTGITHATGGRARIFGVPAGSMEARRTTGFLPEAPHFYEYLRADEALVQYARLSGVERREAKGRCEEVLEQVGLAGDRKRRLGEFSRGMRQRFGFAQAVVHQPRLVFLDEPMSGLDPQGRRDIRELILCLRDTGATVFFSSHILPDVEMICNRVGILDRGRLRATGRLDEVLPHDVKCVEVSAEGVAAEGLARLEGLAATVRRRGTRIWARVDEDKVNDAIDIIRSEGGNIREVVPQRITLEEALLQEPCAEQPHSEGERDATSDSGP